jgi:hypothetical protein
MNLSLPQRIKISDDVVFQEVSGEYVLLNMASEQYFGLDDIGAQIWRVLAASGQPETVIVELQKEYDVDEETLRHDLALLLNDLKTEGLITSE